MTICHAGLFFDGAGQLGEFSVLGEELVVSAGFDDLPLFEDVDAVGILNGGEAVGDDDAGAILHQGVEGLLNEEFGLVVDGGGGFIEEEDGRVLEEGAGDGEALFFSAGEFDAAFADIGVELLGKITDEIGLGGIEGLPDLLIGGVAHGEGEVFANGAVEEKGFLGDVAEGVAE